MTSLNRIVLLVARSELWSEYAKHLSARLEVTHLEVTDNQKEAEELVRGDDCSLLITHVYPCSGGEHSLQSLELLWWYARSWWEDLPIIALTSAVGVTERDDDLLAFAAEHNVELFNLDFNQPNKLIPVVARMVESRAQFRDTVV